MGLVGKMIGGALGFAMGGPLGAILGASLGHHVYDRKGEGGNGRRITAENSNNPDVTFFVAAFSMIAKIAKADGRVSEAEMKSIEDFMTNDLALNQASRMIAVNIFKTAINSQETFESFAVQFYNQFKDQPQLLEMMIDILARVSAADDKMSPEEERLILKASNIFNFGQDRRDAIISRHVKQTDKYYAILGCAKTDSLDEIKKRYRKLILEYHPDKIVSKGLPEDFMKFANDKFREIKEAYDIIKKERENSPA
jgi:DnaJ like chaperone protein